MPLPFSESVVLVPKSYTTENWAWAAVAKIMASSTNGKSRDILIGASFDLESRNAAWILAYEKTGRTRLMMARSVQGRRGDSPILHTGCQAAKICAGGLI